MRCPFSVIILLGAAFSCALGVQFLSEKSHTFDFDPFAKAKSEHEKATEANVTIGEFEVPLDHFNPSDGRIIRLKYHLNTVHFHMEGPIFININDMAGNKWIIGGLIHDLAENVGGALATADYRFTDRNVPQNANVTTEDLRFTTVDQLLADIALLITQIKHDMNAPSSRVILFGSRLGGTLSILARKKFPHLVDGAWASGGIFRAAVPEISYLNRTATNVFEHGTPECVSRLSTIMHSLNGLAETAAVSAENRTILRQLFNLCDSVDFAHPNDPVTFIERMFFFVSIFVDANHARGVTNFCKDITQSDDALADFGQWANHVYDTRGKCRDISHRFEIHRRHTSYLYRAYSFCTQLGVNLFKTSPDVPGQIFPDILTESFQVARCQETFPDIFNRTLLGRAVSHFNIQHGEQNQSITNAIFSYGLMDQFIDRGVTANGAPGSKVLFTPLYSVEADMGSRSFSDSNKLSHNKRTIVREILDFIWPDEDKKHHH